MSFQREIHTSCSCYHACTLILLGTIRIQHKVLCNAISHKRCQFSLFLRLLFLTPSPRPVVPIDPSINKPPKKSTRGPHHHTCRPLWPPTLTVNSTIFSGLCAKLCKSCKTNGLNSLNNVPLRSSSSAEPKMGLFGVEKQKQVRRILFLCALSANLISVKVASVPVQRLKCASGALCAQIIR